jgi:hypothetical protein
MEKSQEIGMEIGIAPSLFGNLQLETTIAVGKHQPGAQGWQSVSTMRSRRGLSKSFKSFRQICGRPEIQDLNGSVAVLTQTLGFGSVE